jgi:ribose transport system permease protein
VHLAADGKTVVANVQGLILLVSVLAGLGVALIIGLVNGFCIAVLGLSPFVTTLGMLSIVRGLAYVVSNGRGSFPGGPDADYFYALTSGDLFGVPAPFIYLVILAAVMAVVPRRPEGGKRKTMDGSDARASLFRLLRQLPHRREVRDYRGCRSLACHSPGRSGHGQDYDRSD